MSLEQSLKSAQKIWINQQREIAELVGFENRNKYSIETDDGMRVGFAAEQGKGIAAFLWRQFLKHWRTFEVSIFDMDRRLLFRAVHPFRFFFQRIELRASDGKLLGAMQQRFSILSKKFDVEDATGRATMTVNSSLFRIWTFPFKRDGREVAKISKRWGGAIREVFTDADRFLIEYFDPALTSDERALILAAGVFVDLQYFENNKAGPLDLFGN